MAAAAHIRPAPPPARSPGRGGLLATCARSILPAVCVLAPAALAAAVDPLPSQAPQPDAGGFGDEASYLRLGLLQAGAVLSGAVDAEGCEGPQEAYVQAGLLQRGAQLTEAANASRWAGAPEDEAGAGTAAAPAMLGMRLMTAEGAFRRSSSAGVILLVVLLLALVACCAIGLWPSERKGREGDLGPSRRPAGDFGSARAQPSSASPPALGSRPPTNDGGSRAATQPRGTPLLGSPQRSPQTPELGSPQRSPHTHTPEEGRPQATAGPGTGRSVRGAVSTAAEPPARPGSSLAGAESSSVMPPVLCPTLVLPNMDTCFRISMDAMQPVSNGTHDIKGASGRALLGVTVKSPDGRRQLSIGPVGREEEPRAVIKPDPTDAGRLLVFGRDGAPFATLEASGGNKRILVHEGEVKMQVMTELGPDLQFQAFSADGRLIADAGRSGQEWALRVRPKVDAVLVTAAMLAMVWLGPSSGGGAPARPSPGQSGRASPGQPGGHRSPQLPGPSPGQRHR